MDVNPVMERGWQGSPEREKGNFHSRSIFSAVHHEPDRTLRNPGEKTRRRNEDRKGHPLHTSGRPRGGRREHYRVRLPLGGRRPAAEDAGRRLRLAEEELHLRNTRYIVYR